MEQLHNGFTLEIPSGVFPLSTDSMLLADFIRLPKNADVVDLGSGCGTLGVLLCAKSDTCHVTGIELNPAAHEAALNNIRRNNLAHRLNSICADLRSIPVGNHHVCVSNPPYYTGGPQSSQNTFARRDDFCSAEELIQAAARTLRWGGDFFLVHKPERLAQLCALGEKHGLAAKHLRLIRHKEGSEFSLILLQFRKGGKPGLRIDELSLHNSAGQPTEYYKAVYHIE